MIEREEIEREQKELAAERAKLEEEKSEVAKEYDQLNQLKKELHDKKYEESDLAQILESPPPVH